MCHPYIENATALSDIYQKKINDGTTVCSLSRSQQTNFNESTMCVVTLACCHPVYLVLLCLSDYH